MVKKIRLSKEDKDSIMSWIQNTSTVRNHDVFTKLGYNSAKRIMLTIVQYCPKNLGKEDRL